MAGKGEFIKEVLYYIITLDIVVFVKFIYKLSCLTSYNYFQTLFTLNRNELKLIKES
jgi:hypothetical protein